MIVSFLEFNTKGLILLFLNKVMVFFNLCFETEGSNRKGVDCNGPQILTQVRRALGAVTG